MFFFFFLLKGMVGRGSFGLLCAALNFGCPWYGFALVSLIFSQGSVLPREGRENTFPESGPEPRSMNRRETTPRATPIWVPCHLHCPTEGCDGRDWGTLVSAPYRTSCEEEAPGPFPSPAQALGRATWVVSGAPRQLGPRGESSSPGQRRGWGGREALASQH